MTKFVVYAHDVTDPEADLLLMCTCTSQESADYIIKVLKFWDTGGNKESKGLYEYIVKKVVKKVL